MLKKRTVILGAIVLILVVAASSSAGTFAIIKLLDAGYTPQDDTPEDPFFRLKDIMSYMKAHSLEELTDQQLLDGAAKGMVWGSGDVYGAYFTADEYNEFQQEEEGNYVGIGVSVMTDTEDSLLTIIQVYRDSPAEKAGMKPGDKLVSVDGEDIASMDLDTVVNLVRGEEGTQITIGVNRRGERLEMVITRAALVADRAEWKMVEDGIAYIRLYEFSGNCSLQFHRFLSDAIAQGARGFILDLRNNPGGGKDIVVEIADTLFPSGPIIYLEDRDGKQAIDHSDANYLNMPLVVLVNGYSASASELLAGGIQDYGVGLIIGETTFGKGVAQSFHRFDDGAVLKMTQERYLTGGGRSVQDVGVVPDIEVILSEEVEADQLLFATVDDNQYMRALEELRRMIR
ncbi:MAG: S41 family peptidase [Clostridiales bacterium]|nr:S41 family peptidase [Clostridiales bacterium]